MNFDSFTSYFVHFFVRPNILTASNILNVPKASQLAVYSGVSILIYQGFFTLCALLINSNIDPWISDSIAGIGGILLIGVGINLLGIKKIPVGNYILSLFIPFLVAF